MGITNRATMLLAPAATSLDAVARQFKEWRSTHGRQKLPSALWQAVKTLIGHYPITEIRATLQINHSQLKRHVLTDAVTATEKAVTFIECQLPQAPSVGTETCRLEFTCKNGATIKIDGLTVAHMQPIISQLIGA